MSTEDALSRLLQAERVVAPPSRARELGWLRLQSGLAANVAPLPVAAGPLKFGLWLVPKWILAGFGVGLLGLGAAPLLVPNALPSKPAPLGIARPAVSRVHSTVTRPESTLAPLLSSTARPDALRARVTLPATSAASVPGPATFDAEFALISAAKRELDAHRPLRAGAWLTEHAARFPHGVFVTEREALDVLVRCEEGPPNPALAGQFAMRYPSSPLLGRLRKACEAAPSSAGSVAPRTPSSRASFPTLPNGSAGSREPINGPSQGEPQ